MVENNQKTGGLLRETEARTIGNWEGVHGNRTYPQNAINSKRKEVNTNRNNPVYEINT